MRTSILDTPEEASLSAFRQARQRIKNLAEQLKQKKDALAAVEVNIAELNERRQVLMADGESTDGVIKDYGYAVDARERLTDDIKLIEEGLPRSRDQLAELRQDDKTEAFVVMNEQRDVVIAEVQCKFDEIAEIYNRWKETYAKIQTRHGTSFMPRQVGLFTQLALGDDLRLALERRTRVRIAKLSVQNRPVPPAVPTVPVPPEAASPDSPPEATPPDSPGGGDSQEAKPDGNVIPFSNPTVPAISNRHSTKDSHGRFVSTEQDKESKQEADVRVLASQSASEPQSPSEG